MWREEAVDISYYLFYFKVINPINFANILVGRASNLLSSTLSNTLSSGNTIRNREYEVAELLCGILESIANSHSHTIEVETTRDYEPSESELINEGDHENEVEDTIDSERSEEEDDEGKASTRLVRLIFMMRSIRKPAKENDDRKQ